LAAAWEARWEWRITELLQWVSPRDLTQSRKSRVWVEALVPAILGELLHAGLERFGLGDDLAGVAGFDPAFVADEAHGAGAGRGAVLGFAFAEGGFEEVDDSFTPLAYGNGCRRVSVRTRPGR
jgi:hypothetical protein